MINYFKQPFPFFKKKWFVVLVTTTWIFLVFALLKPFGIILLKEQTEIILYFTITAAVSSSLATYIYPLIFKRFYNPATWTIGKLLLFSFSITSMMAFFSLIYYYIELEKLIPKTFQYESYKIIIICFVCGTVPTVIVYFFEQKLESDRLRKLHLTTELPQTISEQIMIVFSGSAKDELKICVDDFLYAEVIKNYVTIYFTENDEVKNKSLRTTLSNIIENSTDFPDIVQCHRAFIVNASKITKTTGNSRGFLLTIQGVKQQIPTGRAYIQTIKEIMS